MGPPFFKSFDRNYKLFTSILNIRLNEWAEKYQIYVEAQSGFRKGMSTVDNVFILHSLITHCINENKQLYSEGF